MYDDGIDDDDNVLAYQTSAIVSIFLLSIFI